MAKASEQDPCLKWLLSSPVALYISEMDHRKHSTRPHESRATNVTASPPRQRRWEPEDQNQRRPSVASDSSAPSMVADTGAPSPKSSWERDEYNHHTLGDVAWDSWLEDNPFADTQLNSHEKKSLPLRPQRSNLAIPKHSLTTPELMKMRSVEDLPRPQGTATSPTPYRTCVVSEGSPSLHATTYEDWERQPLPGETTPKKPFEPVLPQTLFRSPPSPRKVTLLEPRPQHPIPNLNVSLYPGPQPPRRPSYPLLPLSAKEKSVFEDWDEPKSTFWRRNDKRKRRSAGESRSDGNAGCKIPGKKEKRLWNLNLLAMPGI